MQPHLSFLRSLFLFVTLPLAFLFSGCLQQESVVLVKADGSGTITQTVYFSEQMEQMMTQMMTGMMEGMEDAFGDMDADEGETSETTPEGQDAAPETDAPPETPTFSLEDMGLYDRATYEEQAAGFGDGVTVQSFEKLEGEDGKKGVKVVYAFEDINKIKLNLANQGMETAEEGETYTFTFEPGDQPKLTIRTPVAEEEAADAEAEASAEDEPAEEPVATEPSPMEMMMMQQMLGGMKIRSVIQVEGKIVSTNVEDLQEGDDTVVLGSVDMNKIFENPEATKLLMSSGGEGDPDFAKISKLAGDIEGLKFPEEEVIELTFDPGS